MEKKSLIHCINSAAPGNSQQTAGCQHISFIHRFISWVLLLLLGFGGGFFFFCMFCMFLFVSPTSSPCTLKTDGSTCLCLAVMSAPSCPAWVFPVSLSLLLPCALCCSSVGSSWTTASQGYHTVTPKVASNSFQFIIHAVKYDLKNFIVVKPDVSSFGSYKATPFFPLPPLCRLSREMKSLQHEFMLLTRWVLSGIHKLWFFPFCVLKVKKKDLWYMRSSVILFSSLS